MNLIEIQDKLRSLPVQVLQQYANGSNPEVPPYVALGVLQEKQAMAQRMGNIQGAAQGQMPTVKDKVEQASGLLGLQQQKQQQAAQQAAAQNMNRPSPVPAGVRPAEGQPTASDAVPMRAGGLARLHSGLNLARGGIVAFQDGGNVSLMKIKEEIRRRNPALTPDEVDRIAVNQMQRYDDEGKFVPYYQREGRGEYGKSPNAVSEASRGILDFFRNRASKAPKTPQEAEAAWRDSARQGTMYRQRPDGSPMTPGMAAAADRNRGDVARMGRDMKPDPIINADAEIAGANAAQEATLSQPKPWTEPAAPELPSAAKKPAGLPGAMPPRQKAPASPAVPAAPAAPAAQGPQGIQKAIEAMRGIREASGRGTSQYDPQIQAKMDEMSRAYEESKKTRDFENMLRFLGGSAKGPTGQVEAYLQNMQSGRDLDAAERDRQLKAMQGLQTQEQARASEFETGARSLYDRQMTNEGSMATAELNAKTQLEGDRIRAQATRDAAAIQAQARNLETDAEKLKNVNEAILKDADAKVLLEILNDQYADPKTLEAARKKLKEIRLAYYQKLGITLPAANAGASESSTKRIDFMTGKPL